MSSLSPSADYGRKRKIDESIKRKRHDARSVSPGTASILNVAQQTSAAAGIQSRNGASSQLSHRLVREHAESRRNLPVYKFKSEICRLVLETDVVLVVAETVRWHHLNFCQNVLRRDT
jgi:HrpA-like RNA helicase